jgi:hypothetical protein
MVATAIIGTLAALAAAIVLSSDSAIAADLPAARTWIEPVRPYQPGDFVWTTSPPVAQLELQVLSSGCQRVPASGYIGSGVYASSSSQYSNFWSWGAASSGQPFHWYVKRTNGTNAANGSSSGGGGSASVGANTYYWKVQNQGSTPQAWNVCWDLR